MADIGLGTCSITADRLQVVDFTEFFAVISSTILSVEPPVLQSTFVIFNVFSLEVRNECTCFVCQCKGR